MVYTLTLLPDEPLFIGSSRQQVIEDAGTLADKIQQRDRCDQLAQDIRTARFWGALTWVDGCSREEYDAEVLAANAEARSWAKSVLSEQELEDVLNIAVNQALLKPIETPWPGTKSGHLILFDHLMNKPDSLFAGVVDEDFRKRLNNGGFWEAMSHVRSCNLSYVRVLKEVLNDYFDDLDPGFPALPILEANYGRDVSNIPLQYIGSDALKNYARFLFQLNDDALVEDMLVPYLTAAFSWDVELEGPRFNVVDMLGAGVVTRCLSSSTRLTRHVAGLIREMIDWRCDYEGQISGFIDAALGAVPNPDAIKEELKPYFETEEGKHFLERSRKLGYRFKL
jgi:hypothetical protein